MSKIRIWSRACFALGPGASRDGHVVDSFITVPGAFQDMDERYTSDPTFQAAVKCGDIQIMTKNVTVAPSVNTAPVVDIQAEEVLSIEDYKEKVRAMTAEEVANECEKYGAEFVAADKLKDNKRRLMEAYKLAHPVDDDEDNTEE